MELNYNFECDARLCICVIKFLYVPIEVTNDSLVDICWLSISWLEFPYICFARVNLTELVCF